jgi:hypothetical protein
MRRYVTTRGDDLYHNIYRDGNFVPQGARHAVWQFAAGWLQNVSAAERLSLHHVHNMEALDIGVGWKVPPPMHFFLALNQGISFNERLMRCQIN